DRQTGRVVGSKSSLSVDFSVSTRDICTVELVSERRFPKWENFNSIYDLVNGLRVCAPLAETEIARVTVAKAKLEVLILLKANLGLIRRDIEDSFSNKRLGKFPIHPKNFVVFWKFMIEEKSLMLERLTEFESAFQERIDSATTCEEAKAEYIRITMNKSVGFFSATKPERIVNELAQD
ncbi:MAG: hypothetical protein HC883_06205, partial [Bdellovibrionaceae bacterium]|nr:hypothetical protein [Pseudobdellovibrionaceae bacterium]